MAHKYINFTQISLVRCKLLRANKHSKVRTDVVNLVRGFVHCFFSKRSWQYCEIRGFQNGDYEDNRLLGCVAVQSVTEQLVCPITAVISQLTLPLYSLLWNLKSQSRHGSCYRHVFNVSPRLSPGRTVHSHCDPPTRQPGLILFIPRVASVINHAYQRTHRIEIRSHT